MLDRLSAYPAIGWDFDGTLIDHPHSERIHRFIRGQPQIKHVILTFRTHGFERSIFADMRDLYPAAPERSCFARVTNIEDKAWEQFRKAELLRLNGMRGPLTEWERYYIEWKGRMCHQLGLPVLVDDRRTQVIPGCQKYNIDYIHPDEL